MLLRRPKYARKYYQALQKAVRETCAAFLIIPRPSVPVQDFGLAGIGLLLSDLLLTKVAAPS